VPYGGQPCEIGGNTQHFPDLVWFEVLRAVSTKMAVFWVVAPCRLVIALMMEAVQTSETSVNSCQSTRRHNPEDSHLHSHSPQWKPQKSYVFMLVLWVVRACGLSRGCHRFGGTNYIQPWRWRQYVWHGVCLQAHKALHSRRPTSTVIMCLLIIR
jgi:hypothetical protein